MNIEDLRKLDFSDCKNEQQFKMKYIREFLEPQVSRVFCIETEETIRGFPDVMCLVGTSTPLIMSRALFCEFKYSNTQGRIKFQPTQPAFYKAHNDVMHIMIIAYNRKTNKVHAFSASCLFNKDSPFCMNEKAEVDLCKI